MAGRQVQCASRVSSQHIRGTGSTHNWTATCAPRGANLNAQPHLIHPANPHCPVVLQLEGLARVHGPIVNLPHGPRHVVRCRAPAGTTGCEGIAGVAEFLVVAGAEVETRGAGEQVPVGPKGTALTDLSSCRCRPLLTDGWVRGCSNTGLIGGNQGENARHLQMVTTLGTPSLPDLKT